MITAGKTIGIGICLALLLMTTAFAGFMEIRRPQTLPWYQVENWEIDVCSKWGGRQAAEHYETTGRFPYGAASYTMQGKKIRQYKAPTIYQIGYYIESFSIPLDYKLYLVNDETQKTKYIEGSVLGLGNAVSDYLVHESEEEFTHIRLLTPGSTITTPLVDAK